MTGSPLTPCRSSSLSGRKKLSVGIIDLIKMKGYIYEDDLGVKITECDIPEEMASLAEEYRANLMDAVADADDSVMEKYLEGSEISEEEIKRCITHKDAGKRSSAVLCGTSYKNKGVQKLLDAVIDYMPSPLDVPHVKGINPDTGEEEERETSEDAPFSALAFKIMTDPYVGRLCFVRVYSGKLSAGSATYNSNKGKARAYR